MPWNPDTPFPASASVGETDSGARNLPHFLCSMLEPGPVLVIGASEVCLVAAADHPVIVLDWNRRRLTELAETARHRGLELTTLCRDPERQDLGLPARSVANVICVDALGHFHDDVGVLEKLHRVLAPEGRLVVRVRACPWVGEERGRVTLPPNCYEPETLREALEEASFRTVRLRHWNALGVPAAFLWDRWLKRPHRDRGGMPSSERPRHWWDSALDFWFRTVEKPFGFPVGVSLVAVATPHLEKCRVRREVMDRSPAARVANEAYEPLAYRR